MPKKNRKSKWQKTKSLLKLQEKKNFQFHKAPSLHDVTKFLKVETIACEDLRPPLQFSVTEKESKPPTHGKIPLLAEAGCSQTDRPAGGKFEGVFEYQALEHFKLNPPGLKKVVMLCFYVFEFFIRILCICFNYNFNRRLIRLFTLSQTLAPNVGKRLLPNWHGILACGVFQKKAITRLRKKPKRQKRTFSRKFDSCNIGTVRKEAIVAPGALI